jgi:hypothetical protein
MKTYFLLSILMLMIGMLMIILGIKYRKKLPSDGTLCLIVFGIIVTIASSVMSLCLGFFMM